MEMTSQDLEDLKYAKALLENPGLAAKITNALGTPIEKGFDLLPKGWHELVEKSTNKALQVAINSAIMTLGKRTKQESANRLHKVVAAGMGAAGGFWGLPALTVELPLSTTVMLRSMADIARSEGHMITEPDIKVACLEVFAFGGPSSNDDGVETGYFAVRTALAKAVNDAAKHITARGLSEGSAPALLKLITSISSRFGVQVTEKIAAQSIPLIGAVGGAVINTLFIEHFQTMARGHFIVLRLEARYGYDVVREQYNSL
ncbi:EcsC family protein [Desulfopila sp. IMCC35008]|uniref:EcsC family protein n=1 Tax=Desulfopila sp. IMCC35008 TaxID=2653858 RepID=UPI0013D01EFD|nr:EcsC family protein [Desulfopila sp. IMCC35008]